MSTAPLLDLSAVSAGYGVGTLALSEVSLSVPTGGVVSLLGSNGAGKSTLLRAVCGTLGLVGGALRGGSIRFAGEPIQRWRPDRIVEAGIRLVPEGRRIFADMTVEENLLIGGLRGVNRRQRARRVKEMQEAFPVLGRKRHDRAVLLSGGEQQMLAIGRALMSGPRMLLLDEPSLGLAPTMIEQVSRIVRRIAEEGTSILLVEQNASMAMGLADAVVVLRTGRTAFVGTPGDLQEHDELRRAYFGSGETKTEVPA